MHQSDSTYRADIDGLRAVAVLPVVLYHAGFATFSGGYVGVDVFFVISGFLITSIIAGEIRAGTFTIRRFYERRARRLFPALFTVVFASTIAAWFLLMPAELEDFGESVATTAAFVSNFLFFTEAGYFDGPAELKPLLHTWSLAIEEQYYLLFPGFLLLLGRFGGRFVTGTAILFATSFAISVWSVQYARDAAFYLLPSRTWELLLGSLLALAPAPVLSRFVHEALATVGLTMIAAAVFLYGSETPFPGAAALLPCIGTACLIASGRGTSPTVNRWLSWRPLVFVGLCSYSLYLWHWPLLVFAKHWLVRPLTAIEAGALVAVSAVLAVLSWRFVERPFRGAGGWFDRRGLFAFSGALIAAAVTVGLVYDETEGVPTRLPQPVATIAAVALDKPTERDRCEGIDPAEVGFESLCRVNDLPVEPSFLVWGDSHAMVAMAAARVAAQRAGRNGLSATTNGCVPFIGVWRPAQDPERECAAFNDAVLLMLRAHPELTTVILHARWARHAEGVEFGRAGGERLLLADTNAAAHDAAQNRAIFEAGLHRTLAALAAPGRDVVVIGPVPEIGVDVPNAAAKALWHRRVADLAVPLASFEQRQAFVLASFERAGGEYMWRPVHARFCDASSCAALAEGVPLYFDDNHLSSTGTRRLEGLFEELLAPVTGAQVSNAP